MKHDGNVENQIIEKLCKSYTLEELKQQFRKIQEKTAEAGTDMLYMASLNELNAAIACLKVDHEYEIEVLCTCYSLETLTQQLTKRYNRVEENSSDILYGASVEKINEAISRYDEEQFKSIREQMHEDWKRYGLI